MTHLKFILFSYLVFTLLSCASVPQKLDDKTFYKRDMGLTVNGHQAEGVLVVPRATKYDFDIRAKGKLDLFTFTTCHREQTKELAGKRGWFADKSRRKLVFKPVPLERSQFACPVQLGGYERIKGRHSWGLVEFEHPSLTLPALVSCNGSEYNARGVSVCQSKAGLLMRITFSEKVIAPQKSVCVILKSTDQKTFTFKMPKGQCGFRFVNLAADEKWHRLTTIGYEKILIREN